MRPVILFAIRAALPIVLCGVTACASVAPAPTAAVAAFPRSYLPVIEMSGRMSAQYEANYRDQSITVHFTWSQTPDKTLISLSSPTGQTVATILIDEQGATLNQPDKPPRFASDINALTTEILGWPMPVAGLRDWLQGFIDTTHQTALTAATTSQPVNADGWSLKYVSWTVDNQFERPKRVDLARFTKEAGQVSLRIVVDEWNTP